MAHYSLMNFYWVDDPKIRKKINLYFGSCSESFSGPYVAFIKAFPDKNYIHREIDLPIIGEFLHDDVYEDLITGRQYHAHTEEEHTGFQLYPADYIDSVSVAHYLKRFDKKNIIKYNKRLNWLEQTINEYYRTYVPAPPKPDPKVESEKFIREFKAKNHPAIATPPEKFIVTFSDDDFIVTPDTQILKRTDKKNR